MKKFAAFLLALLILGIFVFVAWWLYRSYHSTPVLILNLLIILTGVLISYTIYNYVFNSDKNITRYTDEDFPPVETGLIYAQVEDFCNKYEKEKGKLFIIGFDIPEEPFQLTNVKFDKLTDQLTFQFSPALKLELTGVSTIAVGDEQFLIHGFEEAKLHYGGNHNMNWTRNQLVLEKNKQEPQILKFPPHQPTILFDWS